MVTLHRDQHGSFRSPGPIFCPLLGTEVAVSVFTDGGEVHPDQLDALTRFLAIEPQVRTALFEPLFANYQATIEAVGEGPEIDCAERVWEFVRWTNTIVPRQGVGRRFVFVQGDPAWEPEHGVELLFRDEQLIHLDQASGAFLTTCFWDWE